MKPVKKAALPAVILFPLLLAAFINPGAASKPDSEAVAFSDRFAVLEFFTSEGCSSCPAADKLLASIQKNAGTQPIYVLAYHVDYWDRLGWKDAFSSPQFTKRQDQYSRRFAGQIYTPQVIINGQSECVGSNETALTNAIQDAFKRPATVRLQLQARQQGQEIALTYQLTGKAETCQLVVALVQKQAVRKVTKGENQGRTLMHAQIVRNLLSFPLTPLQKGKKQFTLPSDYTPTDWEVIGLIQDSETGLIRGAARAAMAPAPARL